MFAIPPSIAQAPQPSVAELHAAHASEIAHAIKTLEGRCVTGQSGEQGCYQYQADTWTSYSVDVTGVALPMTRANENRVTEGKILEWVDAGMSDRDIFLMWNQGTPGPDCYRGVNQWGVKYDSCEYAARGLRLLTGRPAE